MLSDFSFGHMDEEVIITKASGPSSMEEDGEKGTGGLDQLLLLWVRVP